MERKSANMENKNDSDIKFDMVENQGDSSDIDGIRDDEEDVCEGEHDANNQVMTEDSLRDIHYTDNVVGAKYLEMANSIYFHEFRIPRQR